MKWFVIKPIKFDVPLNTRRFHWEQYIVWTHSTPFIAFAFSSKPTLFIQCPLRMKPVEHTWRGLSFLMNPSTFFCILKPTMMQTCFVIEQFSSFYRLFHAIKWTTQQKQQQYQKKTSKQAYTITERKWPDVDHFIQLFWQFTLSNDFRPFFRSLLHKKVIEISLKMFHSIQNR